MRWHKEEPKQDQMLRHPADGSQWRNVDRDFPDFDNDPRNIRFDLSTDGMNSFGEWGSSHSIWPMCKDRWTKKGGELGLFQISKIVKTILTYAMLVRTNSPTG